MKATTTQREIMRLLVSRYDNAFTRSRYIGRGFSSQRYRWDIYWFALDQLDASSRYDMMRYFDNLNDGHMDTLLRSVIKDLVMSCVGCGTLTGTDDMDNDLCDDCFRNMPVGEWVTLP